MSNNDTLAHNITFRSHLSRDQGCSHNMIFNNETLAHNIKIRKDFLVCFLWPMILFYLHFINENSILIYPTNQINEYLLYEHSQPLWILWYHFNRNSFLFQEPHNCHNWHCQFCLLCGCDFISTTAALTWLQEEWKA